MLNKLLIYNCARIKLINQRYNIELKIEETKELQKIKQTFPATSINKEVVTNLQLKYHQEICLINAKIYRLDKIIEDLQPKEISI